MIRAKGKDVERLVLLDSHAILHRAYHAIPDFSSSQGEPTGALYGLVSMLLKTTADLKPDYLVACRDLPGTTERHELFEAYKATRMKADDELVAQLARAPEVFKAFGIPLYEAPGFEADDCLGAIVQALTKKKNLEIIIASGDLDTLQLVDGVRVTVYTLRQGLNDTVLYDEAAVTARFGFGPEYIPDYKGLRGDPSDNIKGVPGIGEKTAATLITNFGTVEAIYTALAKHPDSFERAGITKRVRELLVTHEKEARLSKRLATINRDVPITFVLPKEAWNLTAHRESIVALCDALEFRSLKERFETLVNHGVPKEAPPRPNSDPSARAEVAVALWLLHSDLTNPTEDDIVRYAETDDFETARAVIMKKMRATGRLGEVFDTIEKPLIPIVARMNNDGIALDTAYLKTLADEYNRELGLIAGRIFKYAGHEFNINSPKQLGVILFDELAISSSARTKKTPTGARSTREEELAKLAGAHPIVADILAYRELQKLLSTYVEKMPALAKDGRLHAEFVQTGSTTGRFSSQNPNVQNIPIRTEYGKRIRRAFTGGRGSVLVALDYSQIELRIAAGLSGDENLVGVFQKGGDIHAAVAERVFNVPGDVVDYEMRRRAKVINFGILYGMGVNALRTTLGADVSRDEAARFLSDYFESYPGLTRYLEATKAKAASLGYTETLFGRRRYFPQFKSTLPNLRAQAERMAVNAPIQGTQADIIKRAMVAADVLIEKKGWRDRVRLVLQVHDELIYDVEAALAPEAARAIKQVMETVVAPELLSGVPVVAEAKMGENWGEMKKVEA